MTQAIDARRVSDDEYIAFERASEAKHELVHGVIVAMAGASRAHNAIAGNIVRMLGSLLKDRRCLVFPSDMRVHCAATGLYTYPDISVACEPMRFHPKYDDTLINPKVIFEVLSDSTEAYDRGAKFAHYRTIPSLREYALVSQHENKVEHYLRLETGQWVLTDYQGDARVLLPSLECELPLAEIYDKLDLVRSPPTE